MRQSTKVCELMILWVAVEDYQTLQVKITAGSADKCRNQEKVYKSAWRLKGWDERRRAYSIDIDVLWPQGMSINITGTTG